MKFFFLCILSLVSLGFPTASFATNGKGEPEQEDHEHTEECDQHDHFHLNEIGISLSPVYYLEQRAFHPGMHAHYVRRLGVTRLGAGLGYEHILDEHRHQTASIVFQYSPTYRLHLTVSPGIAWEGRHEEEHNEGHLEIEEEAHGGIFALHLEAVYEFQLGPIDIGPSAEWAYDQDDNHFSLGVHIALPF